jgi:HSP20 family protein
MAGLVPFNRKDTGLFDTGFGDVYNMLDDFFSDNLLPARNLARDTFKVDVQENDNEYIIEADLPGVKREEKLHPQGKTDNFHVQKSLSRRCKW